MRIRYSNDSNGLRPVAKIYTSEEHNIRTEQIDRDALTVVRKLQDRGFETYIVGGAVRDLLLNRKPKDFDVVTSASPRQICDEFRNSREIGRRFRIVHVVFGKKIVEVSTFRSLEKDSKDKNMYGSVTEDAARRDFSINALYYNPSDNTLIDFHDNYMDFRKKRITSLIPLKTTFKEDPVRMIRAVKYSKTTGFRLRPGISRAIIRFGFLIRTISSSRLTEELIKILMTGCSAEIVRSLKSYRLLEYFLPFFSAHLNKKVIQSLEELDRTVKENKTELPVAFYYLCSPLLDTGERSETDSELSSDLMARMKNIISPTTPPNSVLWKAVSIYIKKNCRNSLHKSVASGF